MYFLGSRVTDFKQIVAACGGSVSSPQQMLSMNSFDEKIITKGENRNTESQRCFLIPLSGISKV